MTNRLVHVDPLSKNRFKSLFEDYLSLRMAYMEHMNWLKGSENSDEDCYDSDDFETHYFLHLDDFDRVDSGVRFTRMKSLNSSLSSKMLGTVNSNSVVSKVIADYGHILNRDKWDITRLVSFFKEDKRASIENLKIFFNFLGMAYSSLQAEEKDQVWFFLTTSKIYEILKSLNMELMILYSGILNSDSEESVYCSSIPTEAFDSLKSKPKKNRILLKAFEEGRLFKSL